MAPSDIPILDAHVHHPSVPTEMSTMCQVSSNHPPIPLAPTELSQTLDTNCSLLRLQSENWHLVLGRGRDISGTQGAGPQKVGGLPPHPYPPINKVSAPSQGAVTGQEALTEENPGLLPPSYFFPHWTWPQVIAHRASVVLVL